MKTGVIGAGSWGTAIAKLLVDCGHTVKLWAYEIEVADQINAERENKVYLPGFELPLEITATNDISQALSDTEMVFSVSPSHVVREVMSEAGEHIPHNVPIVSASKGIENETLMTVSEILEDVLPMRCQPFLSYLSGPSFGKEVAEYMPTAVVVAAYSDKLAKVVQSALSVPYFRVYTTSDVIGVEVGGAVKNVMAIATGMVDGLGFGHNTRAALITRGLAEITRLGVRMGANPLTFAGLAGMGDLVLTCTGDLSRNRQVGLALGQGRKLDEILSEMKQVAEGVRTTRSVYELSRSLGVEMPIVDQIYAILYRDKDLATAANDLMTRTPKHELG